MVPTEETHILVTPRCEQALVAGNIHNLIIDRAFAGQGLGHRLLQWAEEKVVASGRSVVRLGCVTSNRRLRDLYESAGYDRVEEKEFPALPVARSTSLYEKTLRAVQP